MPSIESYTVVDPPSSSEFEEKVIANLEPGSEALPITVIANRDVPKPLEEDVALLVRTLTTSPEKLKVTGSISDDTSKIGSVVITASRTQPELPATATIVR